VWALSWLLSVAALDRLTPRAAAARPQRGAIEWVGIIEPWDPADVVELDRRLGWTEQDTAHAVV
jgi:hypothetical protein